MAEAFELVGEANRGEVPGAPEAVQGMLELLGLGSLTAEKTVEGDAALTAEAVLEAQGEKVSPEELLAEREEARAARDFARADEIRDRLAELGWEVRDSAAGAKLVPKA
jgi:cysteinyl-tRNA synthetase